MNCKYIFILFRSYLEAFLVKLWSVVVAESAVEILTNVPSGMFLVFSGFLYFKPRL
jgi:hypothetical protein